MNSSPAQNQAPNLNKNTEPIESLKGSQVFVKRVKDSLGIDLPPRTVKLNLTIPKPSRRVRGIHVSAHDLKQLEDSPLKYMELLLERVKYMNHVKIANRRRNHINNELIALFYPLALSQIMAYTHSEGIPEAEERGKLLASISVLAGILTTSYLMLFSTCYEAGNLQYARNRTRLYQWVSRIFELMQLKQRCLGLRYQELGAVDWKLINTLFYVMASYEDIHLPQSSLRQQLKIVGTSAPRSIAQHFIALQIQAWFDLLCWPTHLHWLILKYVQSVPGAVSVDTVAASPNEFTLVSTCYSKCPASSKASGESVGYPITLHIKNLVTALAQDIRSWMKPLTSEANATSCHWFNTLSITDQFILRKQFVRQLKIDNSDIDTSLAHHSEEFRIYVGFVDIFSLLHHRQSRIASEARVPDWPAKEAVNNVDDETSKGTITWSLLFRRNDLMRLSTSELSNSTLMNIGSLLAYGMGEEIKRPKLSVISRIQRTLQHSVQIDIRCLADYAEALTITFHSSGVDEKMYAVLAFNPLSATPWQIICPPLDNPDNMRQFTLHRQSQNLAAECMELLGATNEYVIFGTNLTSIALQIAERPEYLPMPSQLSDA